jgi:hypothetical protein
VREVKKRKDAQKDNILFYSGMQKNVCIILCGGFYVTGRPSSYI